MSSESFFGDLPGRLLVTFLSGRLVSGTVAKSPTPALMHRLYLGQTIAVKYAPFPSPTHELTTVIFSTALFSGSSAMPTECRSSASGPRRAPFRLRTTSSLSYKQLSYSFCTGSSCPFSFRLFLKIAFVLFWFSRDIQSGEKSARK